MKKIRALGLKRIKSWTISVSRGLLRREVKDLDITKLQTTTAERQWLNIAKNNSGRREEREKAS